MARDSGSSAKPKSSHLEDSSLQPFLSSSFDHANYLNSVLPALSITAASQSSKQPGHASLAELSAQTQTLLSQLGASTARLSNTLTQLADEIIRSGSRLVYEVEVLRGDALSLSEALVEGLSDDVKKFIPQGLNVKTVENGDHQVKVNGSAEEEIADGIVDAEQDENLPGESLEPDVPPYISQLRILTTVKSRLESVVKVFGEAMEWTLPPSEVSVASSFISVSAPEPGSESYSQEEKGQEIAKKLRKEIAELVSEESRGRKGIDAAQSRVQQLRELAQIWKGTAEEKARTRFVDGLAKLVEDRQKSLQREAADRGSRDRGSPMGRAMSPSRSREAQNSGVTDSGQVGSSSRQGGYGFIDHLQRIRGGL
ncbi:MAG: hypothetical protein M1816_004206 [Peltula sp. TS41687]|nr:MAG: hypothetical protein M1816_004206 [Peltula sp. TS41687]